MWFLFGLITLVSFSVYLGLKKRSANWKGTHTTHGPVVHESLFEINKKKTQRFKVAVSAPKEYDFSFKREGRFDRFCKSLGLSVEHQIGAAEFDNLVYVVSNDGHLVQQMSAQKSITDDVVQLFKLHRYGSTVSEVRCQNGRLWASFSVAKPFNEASNMNQLLKVPPHAAGLLQRVAVQLEANRPQTRGTQRDPFILRAAVLLAISTGLFVNGLTHAFRLFWSTDTFTVDTAQLWFYSVYGAAAIVGVLVLLAFAALGRSARTHLVLIELLLVGLMGATLTCFTELRDLNMEMDMSPVVKLRAEVLTKTVSRSRKGGTHYSIEVRDWVAHMDTRTIKVSSGFYSQIKVGGILDIHQRSGYLGMRWVEFYGRAAQGT